jgi:seryl-tRNA synthetase
VSQGCVNDDLIAKDEGQLSRVKDMYQVGVIEQSELIERKTQIETAIDTLKAKRAELQNRIGRELSQERVEEVIKFACRLSSGLDKAEHSECENEKLACYCSQFRR